MTDAERRAERIAAYLDGALSPADAAAFEADVDSDADLARSLAEWRGNDELLRDAFAAPVTAGVDDALLRRMGLAGAADPAAANDNPRTWRRWAWPAGIAAAAALALALFVSPPDSGTDLAGLERLASRESATLGDGSRLTPILTLQAADGRWCREFVRSGGRSPGRGLACRKDAAWSQEAFVPGSQASPSDDRILPAEGPNAQQLEAAYSRLDVNDPLDPTQEKVVMARGWR